MGLDDTNNRSCMTGRVKITYILCITKIQIVLCRIRRKTKSLPASLGVDRV